MILQRRGYAVSEAATVSDAMSAIADHPPQWMLLDLMLPDGCGIDVLRHVRAARLATRTCVVTGCAAGMLDEAREAGAEHTFVKPVNIEQLVTVMDAASP
jgi:DNA-binding response OmpR family regulator